MLEFGEREKEHLRETCGDRGCVQHAIEVIAERDAEIERLRNPSFQELCSSAVKIVESDCGKIILRHASLMEERAEKADAKVERLERELVAERERFGCLRKLIYHSGCPGIWRQFEEAQRRLERKAKEQADENNA